jgi:hypothetical protein
MHDNNGGIPDLGDLVRPDWATEPPWSILTIGTYMLRVIDHPEADKALVIGLPNGQHLHLPMRPEMRDRLLAELGE